MFRMRFRGDEDEKKKTYTREAEAGLDVSIGGGSLISDVSSDGLDTVFSLVVSTVLVLT